MAKVLKAAVIGCGQIGSRYDEDPKRKYPASHLGAYAVCKDVQVVAICDPDQKNLRDASRRWKVKAVYSNLEQLLVNHAIDILSVCTPANTHQRIIKEALRSSSIKAIFCEKPIATNLDDARWIVDACQKRGVILQIGHQRRFDSLHGEIKKILDQKKLGNPQQVSFYYTSGINNFGSHMFDLLRFFFGEVAWVQANLSANSSHKPGDPNIDGLLKFKSGLTATFQACDPKNYLLFEMDCLLEKGRIVLKNNGLSSEFYKVAPSKHFSAFQELVLTNNFKKNIKPDFMVKGVEHLVDCVRNKKRSISSGEDGLAALKIIKAVEKSAKQGGQRVVI